MFECARKLVLLIDDDAISRLLALEALEVAGFEVVEAESGARGLALFNEHTPDVVLLDLLMPETDGYSVCAQLRASLSGANVPIMVMTGLDDAASIDRAYEVGATDFVTKPINYNLLAHRLRYLLRAATAFREARASSRRLGRAQQLARLAQWEIDLSTNELRWSDEARTIFGLEASAKASPDAWLACVHAEDRLRVERALRQPCSHAMEYRLVLPDGRERTVQQHAEILDDDETGTCLLSGATQDVTELREAERKVRDLAFFDALTGLPNRTLLGGYLAHALEQARRDERVLAVLSFDLDGFKRVNDTFGHGAGDALLKEVASRVSACIRSTDALARSDVRSPEHELTSDSMASRLGGDEFVVVLSNVGSRDNAAIVAKRIADRLAQVYAIAGQELFVSCSMGIACFPDSGVDAEALLSGADAAMYHAKQSGRNQCQFYNAGIRDKARQRLILENALRVALSRSGIHPRQLDTAAPCEFRLEFQPKVEVPSGRVLGVEALLRWTSPELGPIPPLDFIDIAEETGLIVPLGEWVLRTACAQAKHWAQSADHDRLSVAVNVSARQFRDPEFAQCVAKIIAETGAPPELIELEITEGLLMQDTEGSAKLLAELKQAGVRIALDDFGTGYSSLSYLTRLPIDAIKIDRSFIKDLDTTGKSATITAAIIGLSRGLDIDVVVEGVETQNQLDFISLHGRTQIQGYLFGRPMSVQQLHSWREDRDEGMGPVPSRRSRPRAA